jgi:hypothetical protein
MGAALMVLTGTASGQVYRCAGPSGKVIFADKPCAGANGQAVDLRYRGVASPESGTAERSQLGGHAADVPLSRTEPSRAPPGASSGEAPPVHGASVGPLASAPVAPLADRLAATCVDQYRPHLAYPNGVRVLGRSLERSLSETLIIVQVRTITNPATPARIDPITLVEKFICVTNGSDGLHARSTDIYVQRHKGGQRLEP